ncbi:MAG: zinc-ribbon and DUF3426 domain-containing protein [Pseudomonadota bacterium]
MITQCSHCSTKFEISRELVESDDPRVRCGECLKIFNARVQLVVEEPFSEPEIPTVTQKVKVQESRTRLAAETSPAAELENYISVEDLESAATLALDDPSQSVPATSQPPGSDGFYSPDEQLDYGLPSARQRQPPAGSSEFEQTLSLTESQPVPSAPFDSKAAADWPAKPDIEAPDADPYVPPIDEAELVKPRSRKRADDSYDNLSAAELRKHIRKRGGKAVAVESDHKPRRSKSTSMFLPLTCVALALAAVLYFSRDSIAQLNLPEPVLTSFCSLTGCELPVRQDLTRLDLLQHKMNIHSKREDVLVINVDMINNAPFRQPYPVFAITMSDRNGGVVAERKFQPADYLEPEALDQTLPSAEPVRIRFEILDPGPDAVSSELEFE